jgi:hypothetical protein
MTTLRKLKYTIIQIVICISCLCAALPVHSQNLNCEWVHSFGGEQTDWGMDAASDSQGDFIIAGSFSGEIDIDPSENIYSLSSVGSSDTYLAKYSPSQELIWAFSFGGTNEENILMVETAQNDNILVCGYFTGTCDFDPSDNVYELEAIGYGDAFIATYTPNGELIWAKAVGGYSNTDKAWACTSDSFGNIYFGGYFIGSADLDPSNSEFIVSVPNGNSPDMFLVKLSPQGEFIWGGTAAGGGFEFPYGLTVDEEQNLIVSGLVEGSIDFDPSDSVQIFDSPSTATDMNCFVAKYSADGALLDARIFGGQGEDVSRTLIATSSGYLIGGWFSGVGDFDPSENILSFEPAGDKDAFLVQLDFDFNVIWSYIFGNNGEETVSDLALDEFGNIVACGSFETSVDFDNSTDEFVLTVPETFEGVYKDACVLVLSADGQFKEAQNFGSWRNDSGHGIAVSDNKILLLGNFEMDATLGSCSVVANDLSILNDDVFAICFSSNYLGISEQNLNFNDLIVYPNPTSSRMVVDSNFEIDVIRITNTLGQNVFKFTTPSKLKSIAIDVSKLEDGIYLLTTESEYGTTSKRLLIQ